jgi:AcrR family transcriptional regulator
VLRAAWDIASEVGAGGLHMEAIARRAGVSKETLYRWWPTKTEVVLDALAARGTRTIPLPDTGSLREDLQQFLHSTVDSADGTTTHLLHALAAASASDRGTAILVRDRFVETGRSALRALLRRGVARGEITSRRAELAVDFVFASFWYRLIFEIGALDYEWAESIVLEIAGAAGRAADPEA